ncbi:MAG: low molecular weight phosphotyrosine protein phosphatase [Gammaproteobacteria bacterium]|nr:low molecular weight phosphotyrosine protein phosphatase [Gammaproteobacteria bacterium]
MVCVGNICRSPMAEGLFRHHLVKVNPKVKVSSAGIGALVGHAAAPESQKIMSEIGIDILSHRARQIDADLISDAELILVMEEFQKQNLEFLFPQSRGKVFLLGKWGGFEIPDPYRQPIEVFAESFELIKKSFEDWKKRLL